MTVRMTFTPTQCGVAEQGFVAHGRTGKL